MSLVGPPNVEELKSRRDVPGLIGALTDQDTSVREAAIHALGEIGDARAVEPLIGAMRQRAQTARVAAARALGLLGDARAVEPLTRALSGDAKPVQEAALQALARIQDPASLLQTIGPLYQRGVLEPELARRVLPGLTQPAPQSQHAAPQSQHTDEEHDRFRNVGGGCIVEMPETHQDYWT